ncbi:NAD-dependent epimerase/dehydratase family protein [Candidatus Omnitrophota bacterium]
MKIFVTGATGFIGSYLTARLLKEGHEVIAGGRSFDRLNALVSRKLGDLPKKLKTVHTDLENRNAILDILKREKPDVVCHSAALVKDWHIERLRRVNVEGTRNVLDACLAAAVKKVVYLSSIAVASGNRETQLTEDLPYKAGSAYGQSKIEAEIIAEDYRKKGLRIAILRPCMVYGEGEPHGLPQLIEALNRRILPIFGSGDKKLQLVSVENVVDVMVLSLTKEEAYRGTYFIADKEILTIKELFAYIAGLIGAKEPISISPGITAVLGKVPFIGKKIALFKKDRLYSIERLRKNLGYIPRISTHEGLKEAVLSFRKSK